MLLSILTINSTYNLFSLSETPRGLNLALSTYKDSTVYYRAGDLLPENLEPTIVNISKANQATVIESSSNSNIINGTYQFCTHNNY